MNINDNIRQVETTLSKWESNLNLATVYPVLGLAAGAAKIALGVVQIVASVALFALTLIPAIFSEDARTLLAHSLKHIGHGIANIIGGSILGIPFVGTTIMWPKMCRDGIGNVKYSLFIAY